MEKVIITGGLGYIGTELCKLYSGEARFKKIIVIDKNFFADRVAQLRKWNIEFIQGDILDSNLMESILHDATVIHHLAGVTNVAYVQTEANEQLDKEITQIAIDGSRNIIKYSGPNTKIIFPSTHVVYEGLEQTRFDIEENEPTCPILTYAKGKCQTEEDLKNSNKNFVILRLGSNYGYSKDSMRINIMPNLFSKITSQNGTIKLFSGGVQYKSLISVYDVARCFKFMHESNNISREIFNCTNEVLTVKEVAMMCKKYKPSLTLTETMDEIPNLGYTLSNKKLIGTGFKFLYNVEDCIKDMIANWSEMENTPIEFKQTGQNEFIDSRGKISNYELTEPINLIGYIESKAGTVRANHYHPIQEQKVLLISGQYISVYKDLSVENATVMTQLVNPGDMIVTRPNVAHTMVFTKDSVLLNLVNGERDHDKYGVTHTIPYILVDEEKRKRLIETYKESCRVCANSNLKRVVSLGDSPLANNLTSSQDEQAEMYPLEMNFCENCTNCQLSVVVPAGKMFDNYLYKSSVSQTFIKHFEDAAEKYINKFNLIPGISQVLDIGSNDGIGLKPFVDKGIEVLGIEPAKNLAEAANAAGIKTMNAYFTQDTYYKICHAIRPDIITASNVFAHSDGIDEITRVASTLMKPNGVFIIEVQYLWNTLNDLTFDNIYHEHVNYWSVHALVEFFKNFNMTIVEIEHVNTHGGSIRVYVQHNSAVIEQHSSVNEFLKKEIDACMLEHETYVDFGKKVHKIRSIVQDNIKALKERFSVIAGYGSPAKATTGLNFFGINSSMINYIIEDNTLKQGKFLPGVQIPIYGKEVIATNPPSLVIVLAWNFFDDIVKNNKHLFPAETEFISIKDLENPFLIKKYITQETHD